MHLKVESGHIDLVHLLGCGFRLPFGLFGLNLHMSRAKKSAAVENIRGVQLVC